MEGAIGEATGGGLPDARLLCDTPTRIAQEENST